MSEKKVVEIRAAFTFPVSFNTELSGLPCIRGIVWDKPACNHWGHVARVTFKRSIIGENKRHLKRDPEELLSSGHEKLKS